HRPKWGGRDSGRAGRWRRRLHDQAVQLRGAPGPGEGPAAGTGYERAAPARGRRSGAGSPHPAGSGRRAGGGALGSRVQSGRAAVPSPRPSPVTAANPVPRLGIRLRSRVERGRRLRRLPAEEAGLGAHRDREGNGLPALTLMAEPGGELLVDEVRVLVVTLNVGGDERAERDGDLA